MMYQPRTYLQLMFLSSLLLSTIGNGLCNESVSDNGSILKYSRASLLEIRDSSPHIPTTELPSIPPEILRNDSNKKKRKRGKRGGVRTKSRKRVNRLPLPPVVFGNVRSIVNKEDELSANIRFLHEYRESGLICLVETWLKEEHPDPCLNGFTTVRHDRTQDSEKEHGGGLLTLVNNKWCKNICIKSQHCDKNIEILALGLRPFYLPREFASIHLLIVYAPPDSNYNDASETLTNTINDIENNSPDSVIIILGDFNQCKFQQCIPHFQQFVKCPTRNDAILDLFFCNVPYSYNVQSKPPLGNSDHKMLHCIPKYKPKYKTSKPTTLTIHDWNETTIEKLRGCFDCTDWNCLYDEYDDLDSNSTVFTDYINFCVELNIPKKTIKCFPNNKPWVTSELKQLLNEKKAAIASKDKNKIKDIQNVLTVAINSAKRSYKQRIQNLFNENNPRNAWKGLKILSGFNVNTPSLPDVDDDQTFADELNHFYARFDVHNFENERNSLVSDLNNIAAERIIIDPNEVHKTLSIINTRKSAGPDKLGGKVLKECRSQLTPAICRLFQRSMDDHVIPAKWLTAELVPVPKVKRPSTKNDLRPIALTPIIMKCFERVVLKELKPERYVDKCQYAYMSKRSVEDANLILHHKILSHLDKVNTYVRILFIDFSSAFNTIQPHLLIQKLIKMGINPNLILWINSFLVNRLQYVRFKSSLSNVITINTGAPQGCVLSANLFTLYTSDKTCQTNNCFLVKYADDTVITGLLSNCFNEMSYRTEINKFVTWCDKNHLNLNVKKTKEIIVDFRKKHTTIRPIEIKGETVDVVTEYKYLGTLINDKITGSNHIQKLAKKANQRLFFVRKLRKINVSRRILSLFYKATIESILSFCIVVWYGNTTSAERKKLKRVIRTAHNLGCTTSSLEDLYKTAIMKKLKEIRSEKQHPLHNQITLLPSGRRLNNPYTRTTRFKNSFIPSAINMFNKPSA